VVDEAAAIAAGVAGLTEVVVGGVFDPPHETCVASAGIASTNIQRQQSRLMGRSSPEVR